MVVIFGYNGRDGVVTDNNGLYYMRARYYSPDMRRFLNADIVPGTIEKSDTLNRYAYTMDDFVIYKRNSISDDVPFCRMTDSCFLPANSSSGAAINGSSLYSDGLVVDSSLDNDGTVDGREELEAPSEILEGSQAPWYAQSAIGAAPDLINGARYLTAKGMHSYFAYKKNYYYMFPILGGSHNRLAIHSTNFGKMTGATLKELVTGKAKAGIGSIARNATGVGAYTFGVNLLFNLHENEFDFSDKDMWIDTGIDTAIGMGAYGLSVGAASLATAALTMVGVALPGVAVVGGIILLSIGFEHLIREVAGYWE